MILVMITLAVLFGRYLDSRGYLIARGGDTIYAQGVVYFSLIVGAIGFALGVAAVIKKYKRHAFLQERLEQETPGAGRG